MFTQWPTSNVLSLKFPWQNTVNSLVIMFFETETLLDLFLCHSQCSSKEKGYTNFKDKSKSVLNDWCLWFDL